MTERHPATRLAAQFAAGLRFEDIPAGVIEDAKNQMLSVLGAVMASSRMRIGDIIAGEAGRLRDSGASTLIPTGVKVDAPAAAWANSALSMALDYDDYLFAGHTGHSAVIASLAVGEELGSDGKDILVAQTAANELGARLGTSVFFSHQNGQLWSFIHCLGASAATGRLMGLDAWALENAFGIALSQPPFALYAGFLGGESKALTASGPNRDGILASRLSARGLEAPAGIIEDPQGFCAAFSPAPILRAFTGFGQAWLSKTLSFKIYPGCAYIDSVVDAVLNLKAREAIEPGDVASIEIGANVLTMKMDELSRPLLKGPETAPVTLNFSVPYNVAAALIHGELGPGQFSRERIRDPGTWDLASKVTLAHDPLLSLNILRHSTPFPIPVILREAGPGIIKFVAGKISVRDFVAGHNPFNPGLSLLSEIWPLQSKTGPASLSARTMDFARTDLDQFKMAFGARVRIRTQGGRIHESEQIIPNAAAGRPASEKRSLMEAKFLRESEPVIGPDRARKALEIIKTLEQRDKIGVRELIKLLCR